MAFAQEPWQDHGQRKCGGVNEELFLEYNCVPWLHELDACCMNAGLEPVVHFQVRAEREVFILEVFS